MKNKLKKMIAKLEARMAALVGKADAAADVAELRSINTEIDAVKADLAEARAMLAEIEAEEEEARAADPAVDDEDGEDEAEQRSTGKPTKKTIIGSYGQGAAGKTPDERAALVRLTKSAVRL